MLKVEKFDYIIDLHNNLRSFRVKKTLKAKSYAYKKFNIQKWVYVNLKWNLMPDVHIVDRYMETLSSFSVENDQSGLEYFIPEKDEVELKDIPLSHHAGYIGLVIGAVHNTKKLPLDKLKKLCSAIDHPIILLGGGDDFEIGKQVSSIDPVKIYNACGKFTLNESVDIVRKAKFIITHDTGLMHIAAAFKKPIISVWGNTVPEFGMYPYYGQAKIQNEKVENKNLGCRPCSKIGYKKCPKGHFNCMNKLSMNTIIDTSKIFLQ
jgi:ADP-heptose:LPS heptosyltransferase